MMMVVALELCRGGQYARRCGALGCLLDLGIVIPRLHPSPLVPPIVDPAVPSSSHLFYVFPLSSLPLYPL